MARLRDFVVTVAAGGQEIERTIEAATSEEAVRIAHDTLPHLWPFRVETVWQYFVRTNPDIAGEVADIARSIRPS